MAGSCEDPSAGGTTTEGLAAAGEPGHFHAEVGLDLVAVSYLWGRRFTRVAAVHPGANMTFVLVESRPRGDERRIYLRLGRRPAPPVAELDFELRVLRAVRPAPGFAVASPLAGRGGRLRFNLPWGGEIRRACLFREASGRRLRLEIDDLRRFGRGLALLHDALGSLDVAPLRRIAPGPVCQRAASWLRSVGPEARRIADDVERAAPLLIAALDAANPVTGLCHGDSCLLNAAFDGDCLTFFDFEECACGPLALDLASMMAWLRPEPERAALWSALLDGYVSRRHLAPEDMAALPALVLLSEIRVAASLARYYSMAPEHWTELGVRIGSRLNDLRISRANRSLDLFRSP